MSDGAVFDNQGTFQDQSAGVVSQQQGAASSFTDDGSFIRSGNSGECDFQQGIAFDATGGTVNVQTGTLGLLGGGTDTGATFTSETGATLDFGGAHTLDAATDVAGAGTVGFVSLGGTIALAGTYDVTGTTIDDSPGGTVDFTGTIASIGATLLSQAGTLDFGIIPLDATNLTLDSARSRARRP